MSFQAVVDDYAVWHEISGHSPKTIQWYRWMLAVFAEWLERNGRSTHVAAITIADARAFLKAEAERTEVYGGASSRPRMEKPLSDRTLHGYARAIRAFFRWCHRGRVSQHQPNGTLETTHIGKARQTGAVGGGRGTPLC